MRKKRYYKNSMHLFNSIVKMAKIKHNYVIEKNNDCLLGACEFCLNYDEESNMRLSLSTEFYYYCLNEGFEYISGNYDLFIEGVIIEQLKSKEEYYKKTIPTKWHMQRIKNFVDSYIHKFEEGYRKINKLSNEHGIYKLYDFRGNLIYIGRSKDLKSRIISSTLQKKSDKFSYILTETLDDTWLIESYLISKLKPPANKKGNTHSNISYQIQNFMDWYIGDNLYESKVYSYRDFEISYKNSCSASNIYVDYAKEIFLEKVEKLV